jgi:integrase
MPIKKYRALFDRQLRQLGDGRYSDGSNLVFNVRGGSRGWVLRYAFDGRRREMQLGTYPTMSLAEAREEALRWNKERHQGRDPLTMRAEERQARAFRKHHTLELMCRRHHDSHKHLWRNPKHADQWISSLENHIFPKLGERPIGSVTALDLLLVLQPLNATHHETAKRIRQRLEAVWADAIVARLTDSNPPANLISFLKGPAVKNHFESLNYKDVPGFVRQLRDSDAGLAVRLGFQFLILACARTAEIRRARWEQIDRAKRLWRIPAELMKAGEAHDVPLTDRMLQILRAMEPLSGGKGLVFPSHNGKSLSDGAFLAALRRMNRHRETTVHGFRAAFDTWASETTEFRADIIEAALAHREDNAIRAAYNRAQYWQQRVALAEQWTAFVTGEAKYDEESDWIIQPVPEVPGRAVEAGEHEVLH